MMNSVNEQVTVKSERAVQHSADVSLPPRYVVIMPARDEGEYIAAALESLVRQVWPPSVILVVDDGSTDSTAEVVCQYARDYPFVKLLTRPNRGKRQPGPGVVDAFYDGLKSLDSESYDYLAKLDADCEYPRDYFQGILEQFQKHPRLGIAGGVACIRTRTGLRQDKRPTHHVRGATKVYRKACFVDIGGIERVLGWDILDDFTARFKGWEAYTLESVSYISNRTVGGPIGLWRKWMHEGRIAYMQHHLPIYLLARSIRRFKNKPYLLGGMLIMVGYLAGCWEKLPRVENRALIDALRQEQREYLWQLFTLRAK